jgi:hypothetical protein
VTRGKYYIDKRCTNMGISKNAKKHNKKNISIVYQISKIEKLGSLKNERAEKT